MGLRTGTTDDDRLRVRTDAWVPGRDVDRAGPDDRRRDLSLPSIPARQAGPASTVSFAIAGGVSLLAALSHAEVATDPRALSPAVPVLGVVATVAILTQMKPIVIGAGTLAAGAAWYYVYVGHLVNCVSDDRAVLGH